MRDGFIQTNNAKNEKQGIKRSFFNFRKCRYQMWYTVFKH